MILNALEYCFQISLLNFHRKFTKIFENTESIMICSLNYKKIQVCYCIAYLFHHYSGATTSQNKCRKLYVLGYQFGLVRSKNDTPASIKITFFI